MMRIPDEVIERIEKDDLAYLKAWVKENNGFGARDGNGEALLHKAAYYGAVRVATWLLEKGMSPNVKDNRDYTPLHEAARAGNAKAIPVLLQYGADLEAQLEDGGRTPLDSAKEKGDQETIYALRQAMRAPRWFRTGESEVSEVVYKDKINYKVTQIFNFAARSYVLLMHNENTKAESVTMKTFGDMADKQLVQAAEKAFIDLGGTLPEDYGMLSLEKPVAKGLRKSTLGTGTAR